MGQEQRIGHQVARQCFPRTCMHQLDGKVVFGGKGKELSKLAHEPMRNGLSMRGPPARLSQWKVTHRTASLLPQVQAATRMTNSSIGWSRREAIS